MELPTRQRAFFDLARSLLRLDRSMQQVIEDALRGELDLGLRSMFVLAAIDRGASHPGAVAERLNLPPPSITRTLEALGERGLVTRERSRADRRLVELALTPKGSDLVGRARAVLAQALAEAWPDVPAERAADLAVGLEDLVESRRRTDG